MTVEITLPPLAAPVDELWHVLLDLGERLSVPWTLIGGQMVLLHALEHGHVPPQISQDGDVVADVRARPGGLSDVVDQLASLGFDLESVSVEGIGHRYVRPSEPRNVVVDVLAPDGLGQRANVTTTPPGRTIEVPGGTQLLARSEPVRVVHESRVGEVPRPNLLAAIVGKAVAAGLPDPARHYRDLALLCALVPDPFELAGSLTGKDRQRLKRARLLDEAAHPAWLLVPETIRAEGQITFSVLRGN